MPGQRPQDELLHRVERPFQLAGVDDGTLNQACHDSTCVLKTQGIKRHGEESVPEVGRNEPG